MPDLKQIIHVTRLVGLPIVLFGVSGLVVLLPNCTTGRSMSPSSSS